MRTPLAVCAVLLCILCSDQNIPAPKLFPTSCHTAPHTVDHQQPDGAMLTIAATGNAVLHYTETLDGYTLLKGEHGGYEYAKINRSGSLTASGLLAHNPAERKRSEKRALRSLQTHLRHSAQQEETIESEFRSQPGNISNRSASRFPSIGNQKVLVILIQYPDLLNQHSNEDFEALMNEEGYNGTGSFRDYFLKNSFGQLDLDADVFGWYTSEEDHDYYGYQNGFQRSRELMAEALDAAEAAGVDFSQYDNDGDGKVDAVVGIHSGPGAEVGAQTQYIWSHRWTLGSTYERTYDGVLISDYMINPETRPWGMVGVGVFCHEFGHVLGLPDLYDTDNSSSGIGNWGLMAKGAWLNLEKTPSNLNAWSKYANDWLAPEVITSGAFSLECADDHAACYRINTDDPKEYFLLENRQKIGNDSYLPGSGLAIWHVNEERTSMYPNSNNVNSDENNKGVDLEEADGLFQLDSGPFNGDNGDLFPGNGLSTVFNSTSQPSSNMNNGETTDISVTNIRELNGLAYFRLNDEVSCAILSAVAGDQFGCGNGTYDQEIIIDYEFEPLQGELSVNGQSFPITGSPQSVLLTGLPADGASHNLLVAFTEDLSCDFTVQDAFTAAQAHNLNITETTCNPSEAGVVTMSYGSSAGCDSTVTITTILLPSYDITIHNTTCSFDLAGTFVNTYTTAGGCDSVITLINTYEAPDTVFITASTCDPLGAGTEVFHYVDENGCDSIVSVETTILDSYNNVINSYSCDPGAIGSEVIHLQTSQGCDSVVTIETHLVPTYNVEVSRVVCEASSAGVEIQYHESIYGCDSIVTLYNEYSEVQAEFESSTEGLQASFTTNSDPDTKFIWIFGDGSLSTNPNPEHIYTQPGIYPVWLAAWSVDCPEVHTYLQYIVVESDEEQVIQIADESFDQPTVMVYPNPTFGPVNVEVAGFEDPSVEISVFDIKGHLVLREQIEPGISVHDYDLGHIGPGLYVMQVASEHQVATQKLFVTN